MLSLAVQHHPARADLLTRLLTSLGRDASRAQIVVDPEPDAPKRSPWRTYRAALELTPEWATHRLILQDDAIAAPGMFAAAERAVAARPDVIVCLFVTGHTNGCAGGTTKAVRRAVAAGEHWALVNPQSFLPVIACSWPVALARKIVEWVDSRHFAEERLRSDDYLGGTFARLHKIPVWATVPCLVQHPDDNPSLIGRPNRAGADRGRVAAVWQPELDLTTIAW